MSSARCRPSDTQRVFDLIVQQAAKLCEVPVAAVATVRRNDDSSGRAEWVSMPHMLISMWQQYSRPVGLDSTMGRAILNRRVEQSRGYRRRSGSEDPLPRRLLVDDWQCRCCGKVCRSARLVVARPVTGAFSNNQIMLLKTFADQAVIAITGAENLSRVADPHG